MYFIVSVCFITFNKTKEYIFRHICEFSFIAKIVFNKNNISKMSNPVQHLRNVKELKGIINSYENKLD